MRYRILLAVVIVVSVMLWNAFSQKGVSDLSIDFEEIALYRNENNTGPVKRIYIVTVSDTVWSDMESFGNLQPYNKLGTTEIFFFLKGSSFPTQVNGNQPYFSAFYNAGVVARYTKNASGLTSLKKYPFAQ